MRELKATTIYDAYWKANSVGEGTGILVYLKPDVDKVIAHYKYKRCLAMAKWCESKVYHIRRTPLCDMDEHEGWQHDDEFWQRWRNRWLELAEKFKEAK